LLFTGGPLSGSGAGGGFNFIPRKEWDANAEHPMSNEAGVCFEIVRWASGFSVSFFLAPRDGACVCQTLVINSRKAALFSTGSLVSFLSYEWPSRSRIA
jgi:hypothetical protein